MIHGRGKIEGKKKGERGRGTGKKAGEQGKTERKVRKKGKWEREGSGGKN